MPSNGLTPRKKASSKTNSTYRIVGCFIRGELTDGCIFIAQYTWSMNIEGSED